VAWIQRPPGFNPKAVVVPVSWTTAWEDGTLQSLAAKMLKRRMWHDMSEYMRELWSRLIRRLPAMWGLRRGWQLRSRAPPPMR